jgi:hypothetical protein
MWPGSMTPSHVLPSVPSELTADLIVSETPVNVSEHVIGTNDQDVKA